MLLRPYLPSASFSSSFLRTLSFPAVAVAALLLTASYGYATPANQFYQLTVHSTGGTPVAIVTADFNHDGKPDVVALNSNNVLSILLGSGNGSFAAWKYIATLLPNTANPGVMMVAGDFNGDGQQDVAVAPSPGNVVRVFLGRGDGTFAGAVNFADGLTSGGDLEAGDFNGDGKEDIAVANSTSVAVLLGTSSGILASPIVAKTDLSASGHLVLALGDVNGDSHLDIAANDSFGNSQILLGTGSGHFSLKPTFSTGSLPGPMQTAMAISDFTGDGLPDLAISSNGDSSIFFLGQTCLIPGYGDGTFNLNSMTCTSAPLVFNQMLATNLNGKPDLVFSSDPMMVQFNDGKGVLTESTYATGGGPMALGDFNGDGREDIVEGTIGGVQVVVNSGSGILRAPLSISDIAGPWTASMVMNSSDFNGDGYADLAVLDYFDEHGYIEPQINTLLGGAKNLVATSGAGLGFYSFSDFTTVPLAIGDFNHDGHLDIAIQTTDSVTWNDANQDNQPYTQVFFGDGKGNFLTQGPPLDLSSNFYVAGDFNGDGKSDLASLVGSDFEILIGNGDGTFSYPVSYTVGVNPVFVLQTDLNGDRKKDIIVVNQGSDDVSVLLGRGDGAFLPQRTFAAGKAPTSVTIGDFNRDGKIDMAVGSSEGISVLLGNGDGTFQAAKTYPVGGTVTGIAQAPLRQDGIEDLIGTVPASQRFVVLPGTGAGTFGSAVVFPLDRAPTQMLAADFNHDGAMDLAFLSTSFGNDPFTGGGGVAVFYNQGGDHVTLTSSVGNPVVNQPVTFTAHVTLSNGETGTPTGVVTFKDGSRYLGNISLRAGAASITTKLTAGTHKIVADYSGYSTLNPNHSATLTIVVAP